MAVQFRIFGQQLGAGRQRKILDKLIEEQQGDEDLRGAMDDAWEQGRSRMTRPELEAFGTALRQKAADVKLVERGSKDYLDKVATFASGASPEDVKAYTALSSDVRFARDLVRNGHQEGFQLLAGVGQRIQNMENVNEVQRLKVEADEAALKAQIGTDNFNRRRLLAQDYARESAPYVEASQSFQTLEGLYKSPNRNDAPLASQAAATAYIHAMNPGSSFRPGTDPGDEFWGEIPFGGLVKQVALQGATLTDDQWRAMYATAAQRMAEHNADQVERNTRASESAGKFLDPQYVDFILPVTSLPTLSPTEAGTPAPPGAVRPPAQRPEGFTSTGAEPDSTATQVGASVAEGVKTALGAAADFATGAVPLLNARPWEAPYKRRNTDEYVTAPAVPNPPQYSADGTTRGVYVPRFMRGAQR